MAKILGILVLFILLILMGLPIVFSMGVLSLTAFAGESMYFTAVAQKLFSSIDSFSYLSIVLFIFAAEVMTCCELTEDLVKFCNAFIGHIRGGLALVNVLASMLFAGVSGSASADTSGLGRVEIDMMTKAGYDRTYSTTVTVASSIIGPIIPPSNIFIIYATIASCSVAGMFMAGILPGIILGVIYMIHVNTSRFATIIQEDANLPGVSAHIPRTTRCQCCFCRSLSLAESVLVCLPQWNRLPSRPCMQSLLRRFGKS